MSPVAKTAPFPVLETPRLSLSIPAPEAAPRVVEYLVRNQDHLECWEPPRPAGFYSPEFWQERLRQNRVEYARRESARFFACERHAPEGAMLGIVSVSHIVGGALMSGILGYSIDRRFQGRGLMFEALECVLHFAFSQLGLHRITASYMPENVRSGRLLERLAFEREGYAKEYLFIQGCWRDHVLVARRNPRECVPGRPGGVS